VGYRTTALAYRVSQVPGNLAPSHEDARLARKRQAEGARVLLGADTSEPVAAPTNRPMDGWKKDDAHIVS